MRGWPVFAIAWSLGGCELDPIREEWDGCGDGLQRFPEACDDGNQVSEDGCTNSCELEHLVRATWSLQGATGAQPCPLGFDSATVTMQRYSGDLDGCARLGACDGRLDPPLSRTFSCEAALGPMFVPDRSSSDGDYLVSAAITNADRSEVYATSLPAVVTMLHRDGFESQPVDAPLEILVDSGYIRVLWGVFAEQTDPETRSEGCQLLIATFRVTARPIGGGEPFTQAFDCQDRGTTMALPAGTYTVEVTGGTGSRYGSAEPFTDVVVAAPNRVTELGMAVILLPPPVPAD
ncbi:MAG: hypothetical protein AB7O24_04685 [Kofleriaceae bacterium]